MARYDHHSDVARLVINGLPKGMVRTSTTMFEWDISGRCTSPVTVEKTGRPAADWLQRHRYVTVAPKTKTTLSVLLWTKCRKCPPCIRERNTMWAARALSEVRSATNKGCRTWFCTFTLHPQAHYEMQCRAIVAADSRSIPTREINGQDLLTLHSREVEKELTLMLKRLRKELGSLSMRYLLVREQHESGLPHWHAFIHETDPARPIRYRTLRSQWKWGFVRIKLVQDDGRMAARYVTKYLSKSQEGRVRPSLRYGREERSPELIKRPQS